MYGKGIRPTTSEECGNQAGIYRADRGLMRARAAAGFDLLVGCGGAVHSFTRSDAGNDNSTGAAYNERADRRSWDAMTLFFGEIFR